MPMFWVTQHPPTTNTPMRSPPSSYPFADTIIYSIFIMLLSIIPASCKWPHPGYSGNLEMTIEALNVHHHHHHHILCVLLFLQLVHHSHTNHRQTIRIEPVSPTCKKLQHSRTTDRGPQPWMCTTTMSADDLDLDAQQLHRTNFDATDF